MCKVLAVGDDELSVGNDDDGDLIGGCRAHVHPGESRGCAMVVWLVCHTHTTRGAGSRYPGRLGFLGTARARKLCNSSFGGYICVLLVKTISMIYICYIKYGENGATCVLTVGHDELNMGHDEDVSSEAAEGWCTRVRPCGWSWTCHVARRVSRLVGSGLLKGAQELRCQEI